MINENKATCAYCKQFIDKSHISRHEKICPKNPNKNLMDYKAACTYCKKLITKNNLTKHLKICKLNPINEQSTSSKKAIKRPLSKENIDLNKEPAEKKSHIEPSSFNKICDKASSVCSNAVNTIKNLFKKTDNLPPINDNEICIKETAFKNRLVTFQYKNIHGIKEPDLFFIRFTDLIIKTIKECLKDYNLKINIVFTAKYKRNVGEKDQIETMHFRTTNTIVYSTTDLVQLLKETKGRIFAQLDDFEKRGSGWSLYEIEALELAVNRYVPFRGSSYLKLPDAIKNREAVINVKNKDQKCFLWSVLACLHPVKNHAERIYHYKKYEHEFDDALKGIEFPVSLDDIKKFEKRSGISINVYSYTFNSNKKKYNVYPLLVTDDEKIRHVDLLYIKTEKQSHYCYIKNLSRLVKQQITLHCTKIFICRRCLQYFGREDLLNKHKEYCNTHEAVRVVLPKKGEVIKFTNYKSKMKIPFVMYADFECMLVPISTCQPPNKIIKDNKEEDVSYTMQYQHHEARTFALYTTYIHGDYRDPITYFGVDAGKKFSETIKSELEGILQFYEDNEKPMKTLTKEQLEEVANAKICHICGNKLDKKPVRDHCHLTGEFRGMAHNSCNLNYKFPQFVPIFIHNLSNYDTHLFIKMLRLDDKTKIEVIPNNEERYISYTVDFGIGIKARFLDSFKFTLNPLDKLAQNLNKDQCVHTMKFTDADKLDLLIKKGVYCYDYMDSDERYLEKRLPPKDAFSNKLNKCEINDEDYAHAQSVWNTFKIENMKDYTLLYNKTDVLLLADVIENIRAVCLQTYELDPAWYFTIPGLAWSAMLKLTKIELELLTDYEMILMITKGIRGGISQCSNRYARANNVFMEDEYDKNLPTSYLIYLDAVNLYGWAQTQMQGYGGFEWCDTNIDVTKIDNESPIGYILEVDLEYPEELHDAHSELPLAPEKRIPPGSKDAKLLTTLYNKEKYVIHYWNLKLYLSLGMKLTKIHRVLRFKQSRWLKPYIELNLEMWRQQTHKSSKEFFKLMSNSVYGKSVENIRNRVDIRLATQEKQIDKWIAKPYFKHRTIFSENLSAVHMRKQSLLFNKAIYVGFGILDISKTLIYDFHYNFFKKKYGDKAKLQYGDTDSLEYLVETDNVYTEMKETLDRYDTSNFEKKNRHGMPQVNKKKLGTMKDEMGGLIVYEYVGLKSKMYANRTEKSKKKSVEKFDYAKKSKGVKKSVVQNEITFDDYKKCLSEQKPLYKSMNLIRSKNHELYSIELYKKVLSSSDDKRYIMEDGITSLPWGHYKIPTDLVRDLEVETNLSLE